MAKFCVNCGDKLNEDSKFCPSCGSNVGVDTDNQQPQMSASEATYNSHAVSGGKSKMQLDYLEYF